ncbi:Protein CLEC-11 [Aphelenchoides avenae]|nr:Protein CLEC-11 [Aphelenchus avenae]
MSSDGVVRFLSGTNSAQVQLAYSSATAKHGARLKDAIAAVRPRRMLLACAMLLTFLLALSAFMMAFNGGDQADRRWSPTTTAVVAFEESANQTSSTPVATTTTMTTSDRPVATTQTNAVPTGPSVPKCGTNWQRFQSQCYRITSSSDFAGVESECIRIFKGSLVSVHDEKENGFIAMFVRTSHAAEKEFYIGLTRNLTGHWIWLDQSAVDYTAWKSAEPSGNSTSDHCAQVVTTFGPKNGRWEVVSCGNLRPAVCKRDLATFGKGEELESPFTMDLRCPDGYKCGSGTITSPNYPENYGDKEDVIYRLMTLSRGSVVVLTFASIQTEERHDTVTVYDGAQGALAYFSYSGSYYGDQIVRSTGQYMTVRLKTDSSQTFRGFTATFSSENTQ